LSSTRKVESGTAESKFYWRMEQAYLNAAHGR
jgi:hypothetical protein